MNKLNLSELWREAQNYGRVNIETETKGTFYASIVCDSPNHTQVKAWSGFGHETPEIAIIAVIENAKKLVERVSEANVGVIVDETI
jgi:hypothetical protein